MVASNIIAVHADLSGFTTGGNGPGMVVPNIIAGVLLLFFGRRLFWLFVGAVGFFAGATLVTDWLKIQSQSLVLLIAVGIGLIGALVSIFLQRLVVTIAGFLAGGHLLYTLAITEKYAFPPWVAFLIGGAVGAIMILVLFDWALIALSCLTGASLIAENVSLDRSEAALAFIVLLVIGLIVQGRQLMGIRSTPPSKRAS